MGKELRIISIARTDEEAAIRAVPVFTSGVQAGFPSPADDYIEGQLDLNQLMVKHPAATFFVRVEGDSMRDAGIQSGDILVVDRSLEVANGKIVIAVVDGEFTVKRYFKDASGIYLFPENPDYPKMKIEKSSDFQIWGIVSYVIHKC
ncbi:MAG: translesion error-prone DNA polymerase V autoproteolytic subunit [Chlamydiales bacterium]|nr:translesion error-prone DNA polymerase V autoproteolytic subunit [Chlamydiia bacterium]MCP5507491.1 translesion error-prone DNA polymerase V autoproteolytic subunit [Chlamydiales bacterium]